MKNKRKHLKGELIKHSRRNMWGHVVLPGSTYDSFKELRHSGLYHPAYTWKLLCKAYRKKIRKIKIAKYSRRGSKKRIQRAR
jgi:hypothetical protein